MTMTDAQMVELSRWHWRAAWLALRGAWRAVGRRWSSLHPTDRAALLLVIQFGCAFALYVPGIFYALP